MTENREPHRFLKNWVEIPVWNLRFDAEFLDDSGIDYTSVPELRAQEMRERG